MNERFKELAKQAGNYVNSVYTPPVRSKDSSKVWEEGHITWHELYEQKFAELIVLECLTVINDKIADLDGYAEAGDEEFVARSLGAFQVKEAVEDYFGVDSNGSV